MDQTLAVDGGDRKRVKSEAGGTAGHSTVHAKITKPETNILFRMPSRVGALQQALSVFQEANVDLTHIESRPSRQIQGVAEYEFFVQTAASPAFVAEALKHLTPLVTQVQLLDDNPDTQNPAWFPRKIRELDLFADRILDAGTDLSSDHPGFTDPVYRERRKYFADIALTYKHGTPIPRVEYTADEIRTWGLIYTELCKLYPTHACQEHQHVFPLLQENCGYSADNIPQLEDISNFLHDCTGFRVRPVAGLLSSRDFLAGLAFLSFLLYEYIRHSSRPFYTPEPDVCHEILGHVPLLADKDFAEFSQEIGLASLGASDDEIKRLATCYWFTVEFGLCRQNGSLRAYGAGLLSSFGELEYCLSGQPTLRPFEPVVTGETEYPITEYQPQYYVAESFSAAKDKMRAFAATLNRPFQVRYNPFTESVELLSPSQIRELALSIKSEVALLCSALI